MIDKIIGIAARTDKDVRGDLQKMSEITDLVDVRLLTRKRHHILTGLIRPVRMDASTAPWAISDIIRRFHNRGMIATGFWGTQSALLSGY